DLICITESRECKHASEKRSEINTANYMMSNALYGKRVVIVDDLLTSGTSLLEYAHNLERAGAKVEGAVFLARTFQMPSPARVKRLVWKRHLLARIWRKQAGYFL
ncbi:MULTISPECIES: phosphoribosyltransferase, partial [unclassified Bacteroides]